MDVNWEGICTSGLLKQYCKGPIKLENVTLVCWVAWHDCSKKTSGTEIPFVSFGVTVANCRQLSVAGHRDTKTQRKLNWFTFKLRLLPTVIIVS